jgi:hypothetical protein
MRYPLSLKDKVALMVGGAEVLAPRVRVGFLPAARRSRSRSYRSRPLRVSRDELVDLSCAIHLGFSTGTTIVVDGGTAL